MKGPAWGRGLDARLRAAQSGRRKDVDRAVGEQVLDARAESLHVRLGGVGFQGVDVGPLLDDDEGVGAVLRLEGRAGAGVDGGAVLDAALLRLHVRDVGANFFQHGVALAGLGGEDGDYVDHCYCSLGKRYLSAGGLGAAGGGGSAAGVGLGWGFEGLWRSAGPPRVAVARSTRRPPTRAPASGGAPPPAGDLSFSCPAPGSEKAAAARQQTASPLRFRLRSSPLLA